MIRPARLLVAALIGVALCPAIQPPLRAQDAVSALSAGEVDKLRDLAQNPPERLTAFVGFLNQRADRIEKLATGKRMPGREEDLHELMQQMNSILDDLADNLDEYGKYHRDVRKVLPKLVSAAERWATVLKTPAENQEYSVARKLALESLNDVHDEAAQMIAEQKAWFLAHPPNKPADKKAE
jgi:uncharacterized protein Yka (UPF0111/DUF47 family)